MLFLLQIFTRNIKKQKVALSILCHKGILNKHLNACFLHERLSIEKKTSE